MGRVDLTYINGDRAEVGIRGHRVWIDRAAPEPGGSAGPSPTEVFVASLVACAAFFAESYLRHHDLPAAGLSLSADYTMTSERPERIAAIRLAVGLPAGLPQNRVPAVLRAVERSTVHNSLTQPPEVTIAVREARIAA